MPSKVKSSRPAVKNTLVKKQYFKLSPKMKAEGDARRQATIQDVIENLRVVPVARPPLLHHEPASISRLTICFTL